MTVPHALCRHQGGAHLRRRRWSIARWLGLVVISLVGVSEWGTTPAHSDSVTSSGYRTSGSVTPVPASATTATVPSSSSLPALPSGWPRTLELGMADSPGGAAALRASAPFTFRYQYLSGGVNTGSGWSTWNTGGQFVSYYVAESEAVGMIPVFSYYQLLQSAPGNTQGEPAGDFTNLANTTTMTSYYQDLILFFQRAAGKSPVVLQVEPDLWAYMQQRAQGDDGSTVPVQVASTGLSNLAGLPNNAAGFAQAIVRLRNAYAPNVILGYHFSTWGTGTDILYSRPPDATVDALGVRTGNFYNSLGANFDIAFTDLSDRDAAFKQLVDGDGGASWYTADDYRRSALYISAFVQTAGKRVVIWQIPLGNTKMRAENNTWDHYQDNKVEWLLDDPTRAHLQAYAAAGVVAFLFGRGADGNTCACDADGDGVTNPAPIDGNTGVSLSADDDGGFFHEQAAAYYQAGALPLPLTSPATFIPRPGLANDTALGANGSVWVIGTNPTGGGYGIYYWTGSSWSVVAGGGVTIAVGPDGSPWVINSSHQIYHRVGTGWVRLPGAANDIAVGANGSVWVIGTNPTGGGYGIYYWTGSSWSVVAGGGVTIAVGPDGSPWVINSSHQIYHRVGTGWVRLPGAANDIAVGANGSVWVIGTNPTGGGYGIYYWTGSSWSVVAGGGVTIAVGPDGSPWVINSDHRIYSS